MAYVPNADDTTQPTDGNFAESAQLEFRTIKVKLNGVVAAAGNKLPIRQAILDALTAAGVAAFLNTTGGFTCDLLASTSPLVLAYAQGFNNGGAVDSVVSIGTNQANFWAALAPNNQSFIAVDSSPTQISTTGIFAPLSAVVTGIPSTAGMVAGMTINSILLNSIPPVTYTILSVDGPTQITMNSPTSNFAGPGAYSFTATATNNIAAVKTLAAPQYGNTYDRTKQSVMQFAGVAGTTTFLDDFGNTWTQGGGAKVQTNSFKFGTGGLGGAGAANALNGAADFIKSTDFRLMPNDGGWSIRGWFNPSSLPGAATNVEVAEAVNNAGFGALLAISNIAGVIKFAYYLSSDGATYNIANNIQGTTTPVVGTYYFVELTFDSVAGVYRLYVNGVQESTTVSGSLICETGNMVLGAHATGTNFFNGYIDKFEFLPYCQHPAGTAYAAPVAAPSITAAGYAADWFDTVNYVMNQVSGVSVAAGTNPVFTAIKRLYVGELITDNTHVTSLRSYAIRGEYNSGFSSILPGVAVQTSLADNIGTSLKDAKLEVSCLRIDNGFFPGIVIEPYTQVTGPAIAPFSIWKTRNSVNFATGSSIAFCINTTGGANAGLTQAAWGYRIRAKRAF